MRRSFGEEGPSTMSSVRSTRPSLPFFFHANTDTRLRLELNHTQKTKQKEDMKFRFVDLFCGGGGSITGAVNALRGAGSTPARRTNSSFVE